MAITAASCPTSPMPCHRATWLRVSLCSVDTNLKSSSSSLLSMSNGIITLFLFNYVQTHWPGLEEQCSREPWKLVTCTGRTVICKESSAVTSICLQPTRERERVCSSTPRACHCGLVSVTGFHSGSHNQNKKWSLFLAPFRWFVLARIPPWNSY